MCILYELLRTTQKREDGYERLEDGAPLMVGNRIGRPRVARSPRIGGGTAFHILRVASRKERRSGTGGDIAGGLFLRGFHFRNREGEPRAPSLIIEV